VGVGHVVSVPHRPFEGVLAFESVRSTCRYCLAGAEHRRAGRFGTAVDGGYTRGPGRSDNDSLRSVRATARMGSSRRPPAERMKSTR